MPSHRPKDFPDRAVPEDGTRLADFIHKRLFDSYATWSARHFLTWTLAEDHPTWSSPGVARLTAQELPRVRRSIDAGRPAGRAGPGRGPGPGPGGPEPAGRRLRLRRRGAGPGAPPMRLFVYDSHHPDTEITLDLDPDRRHWEASAGDGPWRAGCSCRTTCASGRPTSTSGRPRASG